MKINTALILCAGYGKRLNPLTLKTPKPLLKIKGVSLLDHCINLINNLNIKKILLNSFHLKEQINEFVDTHKYDVEIQVIEDGNKILDTGGGILNLIKNTNEDNFLIFNPDTIWNKNYVNEINEMIDLYFDQKMNNILLLSKKKLSFDKRLKGDFGLKNNLINNINKDFIFSGCHILNKSILKNRNISSFSITEIWFDLIKINQLNGFESKLEFFHATDFEIFKKLKDL